MGKRMDFKAYVKLNVILWEEFSYGKINALVKKFRFPISKGFGFSSPSKSGNR